jgi:anti-sigma regulatory factor (Ser/Thr protein kinase)
MADHHARHQLPAGSLSVALARRAVSALPLSPRRAGEVKLAVSELVMNSVEHARLAPEDHIELRAIVDEQRGVLRVEVRDNGPGPPPRAPGGLGWRILDRVADRWGICRENGHAWVWFELDLG